jgi:hypothetical protein
MIDNKTKNARRSPEQKARNDANYRNAHKEQKKEYNREYQRSHNKQFETYMEELKERRNPLDIYTDAIAMTCDYHIPFVDNNLLDKLIEECEYLDIKKIAIGGDFWDCDNFSRFTHITPMSTFKDEQREVKGVIATLLNHFEHIYICRGNHEKRWIDMSYGKLDMLELFALVIPDDMSKKEFEKRVHITNDAHMMIHFNDTKWMLCHPRNFRVTPLSVVRDLASKYLCNICGAHGHQFSQGRDRSGNYQVVDGGGLFDKHALEYLREVSAYPDVRAGFYILNDGRCAAYGI